jgi:hypothetical protein
MSWKGYGRKLSWPNLRYYPGICLEGLRKTKKNLSQDSRSPGRDEPASATTWTWRSVCFSSRDWGRVGARVNSPCLSITSWRRTRKMTVKLHACLTSALDWGEWSTSCLGRVTLEEIIWLGAGSAPAPFWTWWRRKEPRTWQQSNPYYPASILTELFHLTRR